MKMKCFKIILKTQTEEKVFSFRAKKLPEINQELILFYDGSNRFIKVEEVSSKPYPQVCASEIKSVDQTF